MVVDLPLSTCPIMTRLIWILSLAIFAVSLDNDLFHSPNTTLLFFYSDFQTTANLFNKREHLSMGAGD